MSLYLVCSQCLQDRVATKPFLTYRMTIHLNFLLTQWCHNYFPLFLSSSYSPPPPPPTHTHTHTHTHNFPTDSDQFRPFPAHSNQFRQSDPVDFGRKPCDICDHNVPKHVTCIIKTQNNYL